LAGSHILEAAQEFMHRQIGELMVDKSPLLARDDEA